MHYLTQLITLKHTNIHIYIITELNKFGNIFGNLVKYISVSLFNAYNSSFQVQ